MAGRADPSQYIGLVCGYDIDGQPVPGSDARCAVALTPSTSAVTGNDVCNTRCPTVPSSALVDATVSAQISLLADVLPIDTLTCTYIDSTLETSVCSFNAIGVRRPLAPRR